MTTTTRSEPAVRPVPTRPASTDTLAVERLVQNAIDAFNAGDLDEYYDLFVDDLESYTGLHTPLRYDGLEAWKGFIGGMKERVTATYEQRQPSVRVYDSAAVSNHYFLFTAVDVNGAMETQTGRCSMLCVRIDDEWRIANQHFSATF